MNLKTRFYRIMKKTGASKFHATVPLRFEYGAWAICKKEKKDNKKISYYSPFKSLFLGSIAQLSCLMYNLPPSTHPHHVICSSTNEKGGGT
jgi:hypothetical protein